MVGNTHHPIKCFCMSLYTNKYYLTYFFGSKEKENSNMYEWGGGQAHPSLEYISGLIMIGCGLVRFGWIHTKFCSFALVVWHRLQQRKLILAKNKKNIKKNAIKTQNRQKQPDKIHQKNNKTKKTQKRQKTSIKTWSLTSFDYFVFS